MLAQPFNKGKDDGRLPDAERRGRLVEDDDVAAPENGAGDRHRLALAARGQ